MKQRLASGSIFKHSTLTLIFLASFSARADRPANADGVYTHAALQVSAGEGANDADAVRVEARLWNDLAPILEKRGFSLQPLGPLHELLRAQNIPESEWHLPGNSPANTALIVRYRELDIELLWMTVLTRDNGEVRLAYSAMGFHDLSNLFNGLKRAPTLEALEGQLDRDANTIVDEALAKFKPVPMPDWWPQKMAARMAAAQAAAAVAQQTPAPQAQPQPTAAPPPPKPAGPRLPDGAQVAVLDFKHSASFTTDDARYLSDVVRAAVLHAAPRLGVMTRENLLVLLQASGKDLNECEGECEVDTGRRIGADAVVSGDVLKFGARYKLSLRLHETKGGRLLAAAVASGATLEELDSEVQQRAAELLSGQR